MSRKYFDLIVITAFLVVGASQSIRLNAQRRVQAGQTTGVSGSLAQAAAVGL